MRLADFYRAHEPQQQPRFPSQEATLETLKALGWAPTHCIDVGAYHGEWTKMIRSVFPGTSVLMVEAQDQKAAQLRDAAQNLGTGIVAANALLGAADGVAVEFAEMETGSSVFQESSFIKRHTVQKQLITLDTLLESYPDFR